MGALSIRHPPSAPPPRPSARRLSTTSVLRRSRPATAISYRAGSRLASRIARASASPRVVHAPERAGVLAHRELRQRRSAPCRAKRSLRRAVSRSVSARRSERVARSSRSRSSTMRSSVPPAVMRASSRRLPRCAAARACASVGWNATEVPSSSGDSTDSASPEVDSSHESSARARTRRPRRPSRTPNRASGARGRRAALWSRRRWSRKQPHTCSSRLQPREKSPTIVTQGPGVRTARDRGLEKNLGDRSRVKARHTKPPAATWCGATD